MTCDLSQGLPPSLPISYYSASLLGFKSLDFWGRSAASLKDSQELMGPRECPSQSSENYSKPDSDVEASWSLPQQLLPGQDTSRDVLVSVLTSMIKKNPQCYLIYVSHPDLKMTYQQRTILSNPLSKTNTLIKLPIAPISTVQLLYTPNCIHVTAPQVSVSFPVIFSLIL